MIAIFGGLGSIGRRYQAILRYLKIPYKIIEENDPIDLIDIKRAIIATPTSTHFQVATICQNKGIPFLCEKPLSKDVQELKDFQKFYTLGFVVNNYEFVAKKKLNQIEYDFYNTGRDGLLWDVCQLLYLSEVHKASLIVRRQSPIWSFHLNHERIPYQAIEQSYIDMVKAFLISDVNKLWSIADGIEMSHLIFKLEGSLKKELTDEGFVRLASKIKLEPIPEQDLREDRGESALKLGL